MKSHLTRLTAVAALVIVGQVIVGQTGAGEAESDQRVVITAGTPSVDVAPQRPGRRAFDLPALEYSFDIEARCADDWIPESLSLNVADSHVAFDAAQLSDNAHRKVVLKVPARQLAPVTIHDFCLPGEETAAEPVDSGNGTASIRRPLILRGVASAHASLLCASEDGASEPGRRITYVSRPLDVTLTCNLPVTVKARE